MSDLTDVDPYRRLVQLFAEDVAALATEMANNGHDGWAIAASLRKVARELAVERFAHELAALDDDDHAA